MQVVAGEDLSPAIVTIGDVVAASVGRKRSARGAAGGGASAAGEADAMKVGAEILKAGARISAGDYPDK